MRSGEHNARGLERRVFLERMKGLVTTMPGLLEAAEGRRDIAAGVGVDVYGASPDVLDDLEGCIDVARPDGGVEAVIGIVGDPDGLVDILERNGGDDRAEDLLPGNPHAVLDPV